jgi:alpha-1,2-mannosyltransferase
VRPGTDALTGFALTGVAACLVSPITWVHHLVWLLPALALLAEAGLTDRRRLAAAATAYVLLCSSLVWLWWYDPSGLDGLVGANAYVWVSLALLAGLPQPVRQVHQRQPVAVDAEPADHPGGDAGDHRVVPELLPGVDVGDVHLDQRRPQ